MNLTADKCCIHAGDIELAIYGNFPGPRANCPLLQLAEKQNYEYSLPADYQLEENDLVTRSRINSGQGQIRTGNYAGLLDLRLCRRQGDGYADTGKYFTVEIQSGLLDYQRDYRDMLSDITEHTADLLLQLSSPVYSRLTKCNDGSASGVQQLFFLLGLVQDERFQNAVRMIIARPNSRWMEELVSVDARSLRRFSGSALRQLVSAVNRTPMPESHPLYRRFPTIASRLETGRLTESPDTVENRFVKYVLTFFIAELERLGGRIGADPACRIVRADAERAVRELRCWLNRDFFKHISPLNSIPGNSPLLQRKEGYREVLRKWLQYRLGAAIAWDGGEEVFKGGQRNLAVLYEYWCFFQLLKILREKFQVGQTDVKPLIGETSDGLGLKLQAGKELHLSGVYEPAGGRGRKLNIRFSYNRTFAGTAEGPADDKPDRGDKSGRAGSWTLRMRPDYTVSFWPADLARQGGDRGEAQAEELDLITHVHFDAKYKADDLKQMLEESPGLAAGEPEEPEEERTAKRVDLLKMHSYRDAIRRTGGAYILYPGSSGKILCGFHELLPGLGAFPLRPGAGPDANGSAALKNFLDALASLLCDRISQWERSNYYSYDVHRSPWKHTRHPPLKLPAAPPSTDDRGERIPPLQAYEYEFGHLVLKVSRESRDSETRQKWLQTHHRYNLPVGWQKITPSQAEHLEYLLMPRENGWSLLLVEFLQVISLAQLREEYNYPGSGNHGKNGYYLYEIKGEPLPDLHGLAPEELAVIFQKRHVHHLTVRELVNA